jgi:hypothetical protein
MKKLTVLNVLSAFQNRPINANIVEVCKKGEQFPNRIGKDRLI